MVQILLAEIGKNSNLEAIPILVAVSLVVSVHMFFSCFFSSTSFRVKSGESVPFHFLCMFMDVGVESCFLPPFPCKDSNTSYQDDSKEIHSH
jgi:hypothetical protein